MFAKYFNLVINPWPVNRILQLCEQLCCNHPIPQETQTILPLDKCAILDILDNDFAVSSNENVRFLNFLSFPIIKRRFHFTIFTFYYFSFFKKKIDNNGLNIMLSLT